MKKKKRRYKQKRIFSPTKRKVLSLLWTGLALGLTPSPQNHFYIFKELAKEWEAIERDYLYRIMREFYHERLVDWREQRDGSIRVVLSEKGKKRALEYNFEKMKIKIPDKWDGKWRIVFFDIPEKFRAARNALRDKLKELGFREVQKSVFAFPYSCRDEIDFVVEFFNVRAFVRYAEMIHPTNEAELKLKFGLR